MSKAKIKIFGASGCGNVGDDLIAIILKRYIEKHFNDRADVSLIPQQRQFDEIKTADVLIIGGGGLIYDYDINNVRNYCDAVHYAASYRIPSYFMGMGVQHVFSDEAKAMYHEALPGVKAIATRGTFDSRFINEELHYPIERTVTSRDLVFLYDDVLGKGLRSNKANRKRPVLALSLADWKLGSNYQSIKPGLKEEYEEYRAYLEKELPKLKETFDIKVVCQAAEDIEISNYLVGLLNAQLVDFPTIERSPELVETYRDVDYVITNRYHGLIAAIIAGTPALGVSFSTHKSQRLIDDSFPSLKDQFYTVGDFVEADILSKMRDDVFRGQLKTASSVEYETCLRETRRHIEILKYISLDMAKQ